MNSLKSNRAVSSDMEEHLTFNQVLSKEHPIIFSSESVHAILEGRKTQTRRVVKPQPQDDLRGWLFYQDLHWSCNALADQCPYGQVGGRLLIKETHKLTRKPEGIICQYKDGEERYFNWTDIPQKQRTKLGRIKTWGKWRSSRFMYNFLVRHKVEITGVRVERLQEISSYDDLLAEGLKASGSMFHDFQDLWDSLNAKRGYGWETNCWVWVITFRRLNA